MYCNYYRHRAHAVWILSKQKRQKYYWLFFFGWNQKACSDHIQIKFKWQSHLPIRVERALALSSAVGNKMLHPAWRQAWADFWIVSRTPQLLASSTTFCLREISKEVPDSKKVLFDLKKMTTIVIISFCFQHFHLHNVNNGSSIKYSFCESQQKIGSNNGETGAGALV